MYHNIEKRERKETEHQFLTILFLMRSSENTKYSGMFMYMTEALSYKSTRVPQTVKTEMSGQIKWTNSHHTLAE